MIKPCGSLAPCRLARNAALAIGCIAFFSGCAPRQQPGTVASIENFAGPVTNYRCTSGQTVWTNTGDGAVILAYRGVTQILRETRPGTQVFKGSALEWARATLPGSEVAMMVAVEGPRYRFLENCWAGELVIPVPSYLPRSAGSGVEAIAAVLAAVPGTAKEASASLPPTEVLAESSPRGGFRVAVITRGSGVPGIIAAKCFAVGPDGKVEPSGRLMRPDRTAVDFNVHTCASRS
jgi:hypothetical protein